MPCPEVTAIKTALKKEHPDWSEEKLDQVANATYNKNKGYDLISNGDFIIKEESDNKRYIECHISSMNIDTDNEGFTEKGWQSLISQAKSGNITFDLKHEKVKNRNSTTSPFARIIDAKENIVDGVRKLWAKGLINENYPNVNGAIYEIKNGFLGKCSLVFKPVKAVETMVKNVKATLFDELILKNVGIVDIPANPDCNIIGIVKQYNSDNLILKEIKNIDEIIKMAETEPTDIKVKELKDGFDVKIKELKDELDKKETVIKELTGFKETTEPKIKALEESNLKIKTIEESLATIVKEFKEYKDKTDPKAFLTTLDKSNEIVKEFIKMKAGAGAGNDTKPEERTVMG